MPVSAKFALMLVLVFFASIGYLKSSFLQKPDFSKAKTAEQDSTVSGTGAPPTETRTPAPDIVLTDADGKTKKLSDYRGQVVVLSFWASWCSPCLVELPTFAELKNKFKDQGLEIVPVNVDEGDVGRLFVKDFWPAKNFAFPSFFDPDRKLAEQFQVEILPSNFVIDRQGRIVFSGFGAERLERWRGHRFS